MELQIIQNKIYDIRGVRVMLDYDLAKLYEVETRALKQAVKRNIDRFPAPDFMFELTREESYSGKYIYYAGFCCFTPICTRLCRIKS